MSDTPLHLAILVGSTREGRLSPVIARWFIEHVRATADVTVDVIDLAELALPAAMPEVPTAEIVAYRERLAAADGFVMVVPEYNHSFPAALKHAIDFAHGEWQAKPVGFVSYGGFAAGLRAVEHLRGVMAELHAVTMRDTVSFQNAWDAFDAEGQPANPGGSASAAEVMLHQLTWWARALRRARGAEAYTVAPDSQRLVGAA